MIRSDFRRYSLLFAWLLSLGALLATQYAGEILQMPVCHLCWLQRLCIYPLALILGIAVWRDDAAIVPYVIALPILGAVFALYQYLEQMIPGFGPIQLCGIGASCNVIHIKWLGFITFPFLSLLTCIVMTLLLVSAWRYR